MFTLYDCGANPKKSNNTSDVRQELAAVIYGSTEEHGVLKSKSLQS
ncbi:unnamed protein product [Cylicostephanus goldi]|uniref:Uncharacterized protein n=1 Tax=Cylicostephanus goldi TaxID=71465 RepID=A0A3P7M1M9_CYLGO|nr:unnamed protein product [Cylicostephanus goldi]